jgi:hypothetical protein
MAEAALHKAVSCHPPSYTAWRYLLRMALDDGCGRHAPQLPAQLPIRY